MIDQKILDTLSQLTEEEKALLSGEKEINRSLYMEEDKANVVASEKLLKPGRNIMIRPHTRFVRFPRHTHDYVEMVYMCSGTTTHIINGNRVVLGEGELLMLGQKAVQEIEPAGEKDIAVNVIIRPEFLGEVLSFVGSEESPLRRFILDCLCGNSETTYLHYKVADVLPVQNLIENLLWTLIREIPNKRGINQMTMGLLFVQLLGCTDVLQFDHGQQKTIVTVLSYIEDNYRSGSLSEVAAMIPYEVSALSRLIRKETGKTYTDLLQEKRLAQAAWLLKNSDRNVDEIAGAVGYENISYFHRIFEKQFGMTPRRYRLNK